MPTFQPHPIFQPQGLFRDREAFKSPGETFSVLDNAIVLNDGLEKRKGWKLIGPLETEQLDDSQVGDGTTGPYSGSLPTLPVIPGSVAVDEPVTGQMLSDDGLGVLSGPGGTGTIDYVTGAWSVTFNLPIAISDPINVTGTHVRGLSVTGLPTRFPDGGIPELLALDTRRLFKFNSSEKRFVDVSGSDVFTGGPENYFSAENFGDLLILTNNVDAPQKWDGATLAPLGGGIVEKSKIVLKYGERLCHLYTTEGGDVFPRRVRFSEAFAPESYLPDDWIEIDSSGSDGEIVTAFIVRNRMVVVLERATWTLVQTGDAFAPFVFRRLSSEAGGSAQFGYAVKNEFAIYLDRSTVRLTDGDSVSDTSNVLSSLLFEFDMPNQGLSYGAVAVSERLMFIAIPSVGSETADKALVVNYDEGQSWTRFTDLPFRVYSAFGEQNTLTWDDLDDLATITGNLDDLNSEPIDSFSTGQIGFPKVLAGDGNGDIFEMFSGTTDSGVNISERLVSQRLNPGKGDEVRLAFIDLLMANNPGEVSLRVRRDWDETNLVDVTFPINSDVKNRSNGSVVQPRIETNLIGRAFTIELESTDANRPRVEAIVPYFAPAGRRQAIGAL